MWNRSQVNIRSKAELKAIMLLMLSNTTLASRYLVPQAFLAMIGAPWFSLGTRFIYNLLGYYSII